MPGQQGGHAFVAHGAQRPGAGVGAVQAQPAAEQIVWPGSLGQRQPGVQLALNQAIQPLPGLALAALVRQPVRPAGRPEQLGMAGGQHGAHRLRGGGRCLAQLQ